VRRNVQTSLSFYPSVHPSVHPSVQEMQGVQRTFPHPTYPYHLLYIYEIVEQSRCQFSRRRHLDVLPPLLDVRYRRHDLAAAPPPDPDVIAGEEGGDGSSTKISCLSYSTC
jgi:hypothetical protein